MRRRDRRTLAPPDVRLASGAQLWRLNQAGRLRVVPERGDVVTVLEASEALHRVLAEEWPGLSRFPKIGERLTKVDGRYTLQE